MPRARHLALLQTAFVAALVVLVSACGSASEVSTAPTPSAGSPLRSAASASGSSRMAQPTPSPSGSPTTTAPTQAVPFASPGSEGPGPSAGASGAPTAGEGGGDCDPNYSGPCVPIDSDVDCAGGSGNGPSYVSGPVQVVGKDIYGLDRDDDGVGCE